jgi:hypothetical protein
LKSGAIIWKPAQLSLKQRNNMNSGAIIYKVAQLFSGGVSKSIGTDAKFSIQYNNPCFLKKMVKTGA